MPSGDTSHSNQWRGPTGRGIRRARRISAGLKPVPIEKLETILAVDRAQPRAGTLWLLSSEKLNAVLGLDELRRSCHVVMWSDGFVDLESRSHPTLAVLRDPPDVFMVECLPTTDWDRWTVVVRGQWGM